MSSHTPGPWASNVLTVCGVPANFTVTAVDSSSMEPICFAPTFSPRKYTEIAANSRLIAAAPELLHQLHMVLPYLEQLRDDEANLKASERTYKDGVLAKLASETLAIIRQAEGAK
jgi:hypothetical protein